jgi:nucleoside-diphosphate-sugar epimerase
MTVLVTGATGFIGRRVLARLVAEGRPVRVLCRDERRLPDELRTSRHLEVVGGDVADPAAVARACVGVSRIIHLAATTNGTREEFDRTTLGGTRNILEAAIAAGVEHIVYVSSMSVYDYSDLPAKTLVDESAPLEVYPELRGEYARSKRLAENLVGEYRTRGAPPICIVRPGVAYGPGDRSPFAVLNSLKRVGGIFLVVGGGRRQVPLVYVDNLADALILLLDTPAAAGHVYNVIDSDPPSELSYLRKLQAVTGMKMRLVPVPGWTFLPLAAAAELVRRLRRRGGQDMIQALRRVAGQVRFDAGKLQRDLRWRSRTSLDDGMRESFGTGTRTTKGLAPVRA